MAFPTSGFRSSRASLLRHNMSSLQFNAVLLAISKELKRDQLDQMKYLCSEDIGKKDKEKIDTGIKLFEALTERRKLGADNTGFLSQLLELVRRDDLSEKLKSYESQSMPGFSPNQPDETERDKLDTATNVIVDHLLWNNWRKLGRQLGVKEVKLESISKKHPADLEETVRELLKEWRRTQGAQARVEHIIKALRDCLCNLTADKVEDKLNASAKR